MKSRILEMRNFVCIITILILIGCATTKPPPQYKGTHFLMHQESNGVEVYIEPFVDKNEVKKYFGTNLIAKGIFPVYVKIVNETKDLSIFVDDTTFSLVVENNNYKPIKIDVYSSELSVVYEKMVKSMKLKMFPLELPLQQPELVAFLYHVCCWEARWLPMHQ